MTVSSSDPSNPTGKPDAASEAEILEPETGERMRRERAPKEPPVIEGKAEAASKAGVSGASSFGPLAGGLAGGVVGAAALMVVAYGLGYGHRVDTRESDARIAALETQLADAQSSAQSGQAELQKVLQDISKRLEANDARLTTQEQTVANLPPPPPDAVSNKEAVDALATRLDTFSSRSDALEADLKAARTSVTMLQGAVEDLKKAMPPAELPGRVDQLNSMITALNTALDAMAPRLDDLQTRIGTIEAKAAEIDPSTRAALGLALANLARASQGAGGFEAELDAVSTLMPGMAEIAPLRDVAKTGVPTLASLKQSFPALVDGVLAAETKADQSSIWSKFLGNAMSLITIRRTGDIAGETSEAVLARMEERLKVDDLAAAVHEGEGLSGVAAEAAKDWMAKAQSRLKIDQLVRDLSAHVAEGLATPAEAPTTTPGKD